MTQTAEIRQIFAVFPDAACLAQRSQSIRALVLREHLVDRQSNELTQGSPPAPRQAMQLAMLLFGQIDLSADHDHPE